MITIQENQYGIAKELPQIRRTSKLRFEMTGQQFFDLFIRADQKSFFEVYKVDEFGQQIGRFHVKGLMDVQESGIFAGCGFKNGLHKGLSHVRYEMMLKYLKNG